MIVEGLALAKIRLFGWKNQCSVFKRFLQKSHISTEYLELSQTFERKHFRHGEVIHNLLKSGSCQSSAAVFAPFLPCQGWEGSPTLQTAMYGISAQVSLTSFPQKSVEREQKARGFQCLAEVSLKRKISDFSNPVLWVRKR